MDSKKQTPKTKLSREEMEKVSGGIGPIAAWWTVTAAGIANIGLGQVGASDPCFMGACGS